MWEQIITLALANGLWAVLFCCLLFYQIKDSRRREHKYQALLEELGQRLRVVREIQSELAVVKSDVKFVKDNTTVRRTTKNEAVKAV